MPQKTMTFGELSIEYDGRILAPRPWTTLQARWGAELLPDAPPGPVLELCAGAGQIGLLAVHGTQRPLVCVDDVEVACDYARRNAEHAGLADRVDIRQRGLEDAVRPDERFALVIADPPWVPSRETDQHPDDPPAAIDGGPDGLDVARVCMRVAVPHLLPGGSILIQLGSPDQAEALAGDLSEVVLVEVREGESGAVARLTVQDATQVAS